MYESNRLTLLEYKSRNHNLLCTEINGITLISGFFPDSLERAKDKEKHIMWMHGADKLSKE